MANMKLWDFITEFADELSRQLQEDDKRWGETWKHRPRKGQEGRVFARIFDYWDRYQFAGQPIPWLKIAGECLIAWVREKHPEELVETREMADE